MSTEAPEPASWQDAWASLDAMPPAAQASPAALRLRVALSDYLDRWDVETEAANTSATGTDEDREHAALFFQALTLVCLRSGEEDGTELAVSSAFHAWPDDRMKVSSPFASLRDENPTRENVRESGERPSSAP